MAGYLHSVDVIVESSSALLALPAVHWLGRGLKLRTKLHQKLAKHQLLHVYQLTKRLDSLSLLGWGENFPGVVEFLCQEPEKMPDTHDATSESAG